MSDTITGDKPPTKRQQQENRQRAALDNLRRMVSTKAGIMVIQTYQSSGGDRHHLMVIASDPQDHTPRDITPVVAAALGLRMNRKDNAIVMRGGGMNMRADLGGRISDAVTGDYYALRVVEVYAA